MPDFRTSISPLCLLRLIWKILLLIKKYYFIQVWHFIFYSFLQPEELTLMVENVLQDSTTTTTSLTSHDSSIRPKLNNSKNMEPSAHQSRGGAELLNFKNNCLKMVNNNLAKCNQRIPAPPASSIQPVLDDDECCLEPPEQEMNLQIQALGLELEHDNQQLMTSPWYQQGLSRFVLLILPF